MELSAIRSEARRLISPKLTSSGYPDADLDASINQWYRTLTGWVLSVQGDWELGGDVIYRDLKPGVTDYDLPTTKLLRIFKGEVKYDADSGHVPLTFYEPGKNQGLVEGDDTRGIDDSSAPTAELLGDLIRIRPALDATADIVVNGIRLYAQLSLIDLDTSNDVPDLLEPVQRGLSVGAAMDFALSEEMDKKHDALSRRMYGDPNRRDDKGIKGEVEMLYSMRSGARRTRLVGKRSSYR